MPLKEQETGHDSPESPVKADRVEWGDGSTSVYHGGDEGEWIQILDPDIEVDLEEVC